jgi:hypothetical protein
MDVVTAPGGDHRIGVALCHGEVSRTERGAPLRRPMVVSSSVGIPPKLAPSRPPVSVRRARCRPFMVLRKRSLGMAEP